MANLDPPTVLNATAAEHLAAIIESSHDAIISKDLNGIIQSWNAGAERMFGYTAAETIGRHISMLAPPDVADEIPGILARISRGERVEHYRTKRRTKDGRILSISLTVSPIRDTKGNIIAASKIARDVTAQVRDELALKQANESLARANRDLEHFAYAASHDLQEPLRMVSVYGELLQKKFGAQLGAAGNEYLDYIVGGAQRMAKLLKDLRDFTRAAALGEEASLESDANQALAHALENLVPIVEASGAAITQGPLPRVHIHEFQIEQLFQNLIGNAIRYRREEPPRVHVAAERTAEGWTFSVRDNGMGIPPEYKEQIFGMFKRLHSPAEYPGTGMGLAICQRIVERAGGRIWVESELGRGSTFLFTIPDAAGQ